MDDTHTDREEKGEGLPLEGGQPASAGFTDPPLPMASTGAPAPSPEPGADDAEPEKHEAEPSPEQLLRLLDEDTTISADVAPDEAPPTTGPPASEERDHRPGRQPLRRKRKMLSLQQEGGTLTMSDRVVAAIVRSEGMVEGVLEIGGRGLAKKLRKLPAPGRVVDGIYIETGAEGLRLEVIISVAYGASIPDVADRLRRKVAERIEFMTGCTVRAVNIVVDKIVMQQRPPAGTRTPGEAA